MEPITTFATVVGLLAVFKSERTSSQSATVDQYVDWLRRHEHEQLVTLILDNTQLSNSLHSLLTQQHDEVIARLSSLDRILTEVACSVGGFKAITDAMSFCSRLSDQAVSILQQMNMAKASQIGDCSGFGGLDYQTMDGDSCTINILDARFVEADLLTLCELGFMRHSIGSNGQHLYSITRAGAAIGG